MLFPRIGDMKRIDRWCFMPAHLAPIRTAPQHGKMTTERWLPGKSKGITLIQRRRCRQWQHRQRDMPRRYRRIMHHAAKRGLKTGLPAKVTVGIKAATPDRARVPAIRGVSKKHERPGGRVMFGVGGEATGHAAMTMKGKRIRAQQDRRMRLFQRHQRASMGDDMRIGFSQLWGDVHLRYDPAIAIDGLPTPKRDGMDHALPQKPVLAGFARPWVGTVAIQRALQPGRQPALDGKAGCIHLPIDRITVIQHGFPLTLQCKAWQGQGMVVK